MKAKPRRYDPVKTSWLASCVAALLAFRLVFRNLQAVWSSPAMAVPKKDFFRLALVQRLAGWKGVLGQYRYTSITFRVTVTRGATCCQAV